MTISLTLLNSINTPADGVIFNPSTNTIFGLDTELISPPPDLVTEWEATQFDLAGNEISSFTSEEIPAVLGGVALDNGNLVFVFPGAGRLVEFTTSGELVEGGIDFSSQTLIDARLRGLEQCKKKVIQ